MVYIDVQSLTTALFPVARGINLHGSHFLLVKSGFVVGRILEFVCLLCLSSQVERNVFSRAKSFLMDSWFCSHFLGHVFA